jgi:hypothetical protein
VLEEFGSGCGAPLFVTWHDTSECFGWAEVGVVSGTVANDFAFGTILLVVKLKKSSGDAGDGA